MKQHAAAAISLFHLSERRRNRETEEGERGEMGWCYQTQGWRVNKNRWRRKATPKKPALMLWANNARFHFREQRGQFYLPSSPRHCLRSPPVWFLSVFFFVFFILIPIHSETHSPSATHVDKLPHDSRRSPANQIDETIRDVFSFFSFCTLVQIVIMAVCSARHEALTTLDSVCPLSCICCTNSALNNYSSSSLPKKNNVIAV